MHGYPPAIGGVELSTRDLCEGLVARHGFEVDVFTTAALSIAGFRDSRLPTAPVPADEEQHGVRIHRFPVATRWVGILRPVQRIAYGLRLPWNDRLRTLYDGPISPAMRRAVARQPADVVCAASFPLNHMRYAFAQSAAGPPVVLVAALHTNDPRGFERKSLVDLVNRSYATIAHTQHELDWLVERGADSSRLRVIAHGLDPHDLRARRGELRRRLGIGGSDFVVGFLGQHAPHKGIDTLLRAVPRMLELRPDSWLVIGGARTRFTEELERQIAALGRAGDRIRLLSNLTEHEKASLLCDCDVFASPSQRESFGITTLEAWSFHKPVIVGSAPSQHEVVEGGRSGFVVPYADVEALLCALARSMNESIREHVGDAGYRRLVENYGRVEVERQYAELFGEAAAARARRSVAPSV